MCGIVGYVGKKDTCEVLIDGLEKLEYRGYDSAGIALYPSNGHDVVIRRCVGRVSALKNSLNEVNGEFSQGIAHTRWATHGAPSENNAHPHRAGRIFLVHNGIIENYLDLKDKLLADGNRFESETDTEVFAHLIEREQRKILDGKDFDGLSSDEKVQTCLLALKNAAALVEGHYAVLLMIAGLEGVLLGAQSGAPLVMAQSEGSLFVGSDLQAILKHSNQMTFLPVGTLFCGNTQEMKFFDSKLNPVSLPSTKIDWSPDKIAKGGFEHFMLKEIFEQPSVVADTLTGRLPTSEHGFFWDHPDKHEDLWKGAERLILVACGSAYYAAMAGKYFFEKWARIPVEVDLASEFRYRSPILDSKTILGVVSQSGETADTLAALRMALEQKVKTFAICNVPGSTIVREAHLTYPTKAGPEICVATTKALQAQLTLLCALAQDLGRMRGTLLQWRSRSEELARLPHFLEVLLTQSQKLIDLGASLERFKTLLIVGRGFMYPIALEGALKIKEISYRHAEGYAAGELKHGPIALIDSNTCAIVLSPKDELSMKSLSNLQEMKARSGWIIGIGEEGHTSFQRECHEYVGLPTLPLSLSPMLYVVPLQLMSYGLAKKLGCDIDKPRNLAKSVTVE